MLWSQLLPPCQLVLPWAQRGAVQSPRQSAAEETQFPSGQTTRGRRGSSVLAGPALDLPL